MSDEEEQELQKLYDFIRNIIRASAGQSPEDDPFYNIIQRNDIRETTILDELEIWSHTGMRTIGSFYPKMMSFWFEIADMEDHYQKSEDGKQYDFLAAMVQAKRAESTIQNVIQPLGQPEQKSEKKGFLSRFRGEKKE